MKQQQVKVCFIPCGDSEIELLESTSPEGPIAKFIEKNREGIQHIALRVDNIENTLADLKEKGVRLIDRRTTLWCWWCKYCFCTPQIYWWHIA